MGKSPFLVGKSTISMVIFNSYFDITGGYMLNILMQAMGEITRSCPEKST